MGDMKSPLNTFSDSAKKNKPDEIGNNQLQASNNYAKAAPSPPKQEFNISPHIVAMLEKMAKMQKEIDDKIDEALNQHGITKTQLNNYLSDPKNFTPEQLDYLKKTKFEMVKKVMAATNIPDIVTESEPPSTAKRGKVKSIGTRRNWIPTR